MIAGTGNRPWAVDLFGLVAPVAASILLGACSSPAAAPSGVGVCWRMVAVGDQPPGFRAIARDVPNLESCAALLEGARLLEGAPATGAYNGNFIFATADQITAAQSLDGSRIRIFEAEDRRRIQDGLQTLIDRQRGQPTPGA